MNIEKIKEVIVELEVEVGHKIHALNALRELVKQEELAATVQASSPASNVVAMGLFADQADSYVDLAVKIIESRGGAPMRVLDIVRQIGIIKNNSHIERRSVEATLYQHARTKGDQSRIVKTGRGMYGLRRYPRVQNTA